MYIIPEFNHRSRDGQKPRIETYNGRILSLKDALLVLEGTRVGILPKVKRRLNGLEREYIKENTVFAWNETECGMKRWTDGKNWSASKVSGPFLIYKEVDTDKSAKKNGLVKQSFSLTTKQGEKIHLISYYRDASSEPGLVPSNDPILKDLKLNGNVYQEYLLYYDQYTNFEPEPQVVYNYPPYQPSYAGPPPPQPTSNSGSISSISSSSGMVIPRMSVLSQPVVMSPHMSDTLSSAGSSISQAGQLGHSPILTNPYPYHSGPVQAVAVQPMPIQHLPVQQANQAYYQYPMYTYYYPQNYMLDPRPRLLVVQETVPLHSGTGIPFNSSPRNMVPTAGSATTTTSPTTTRNNDNETLKMLDKGFSNK